MAREAKRTDGRKNNSGTKGNKGGRPPKAEEFRVHEKGVAAIKAAYGSEEAFWLSIAQAALESFPHLKLLVEHTYGRPTERMKVTHQGDALNLPEWFTKKD